MSIFTTREVAIFIYGLLLLMYILIRKNGKDILLPVIKAACHIKLVTPKWESQNKKHLSEDRCLKLV